MVKLLFEGKSFEGIKELCRNENIFAASTPERAPQIFNTVLSRIKAIGDSFYPVFLDGDVSAQKIFNSNFPHCFEVLNLEKSIL